jgi:hypothetical protein
MDMLFGKNASRIDRMFKETGHQNAYFPYLFQKACLKLKRKMRKDLQKNVRYCNTLD